MSIEESYASGHHTLGCCAPDSIVSVFFKRTSIMNEISLVGHAPKRKRYTGAFKHNVISACAQLGAAVVLNALDHGLNVKYA